MNSKFLVEVIYEQVYMKTSEDGQKSYDSQITNTIYSFEGSNKSSIKYDAEKFMDRVIRHGLELNGGSVLKSIVHPSCIFQVGLVDEVLYQKEMASGLKDVSVVPAPDVEMISSELTPVDGDVTS